MAEPKYKPTLVEPPASGLAERMRKARIERGMTQLELANMLHVKQAAVSMIEAGEDHPDDGLSGRITSWIASGRGTAAKPPRGPYKRSRDTLPR